MASIYTDQHLDLSDLLGRANNEQGATLLIPDLQRPYVWTPRQVILLVDSLIRGWPFGTFLTWKVAKDDPVRELARPFWKVVDRTDGELAEQVSKKNPPGSFQMVLDGQQRIQSMLLAVGGDAWGFCMYDRDWQIALTDEKPRGRQGVRHWSLGCLCLNLDALASAYPTTKRVMSLDYTGILQWVVTGGAPAQSQYKKPATYKEQLSRSDDPAHKGRFVRLSRLWNAAPAMEGIEQEQAEAIGESLLVEHDVSDRLGEMIRPIGSLLLTLSRVKRTRVTFLELAEFTPAAFTKDSYNDAVVNIFTRLNTAGRTLTREDITFAWLKIGWKPVPAGNRNAASCFEELKEELSEAKLSLTTEELIGGVSFVWSVEHNDGRLLSNNDLLRGETIRPMAGHLSDNWSVATSAILETTAAINDRGLEYGQHYQSLVSLFVLWGWRYVAATWLAQHPLRELEKDAFEKSVANALDEFADRWLIGSQWAGRWSVASAETIAGYAKRLAECAALVRAKGDHREASSTLRAFLESEVAAVTADAIKGLEAIQVSRREQVRSYFTALWLWHRLDKDRWKWSRVQLRTSKRRKVNLEVDHSVAWAHWEKKLGEGLPDAFSDIEDARPLANRLGNCSLLEKNFNISKSDGSLKSFLSQVKEFSDHPDHLNDWSRSLAMSDILLDPTAENAQTIADAISERDKTIREELIEFVKGTRVRADLDSTASSNGGPTQ